MTEFPLDEVLAVQKAFARIYNATGLLSISSHYIHVQRDTLAELSSTESWVIEVDPDTMYPVRCFTTIKGIEFRAVCTADEAKELGLELSPEQLETLAGETPYADHDS